MSVRWKVDAEEIHSALRHTAWPIVGGMVLAAWKVVEQGISAGQWGIEWPQVLAAAKVAAVAGVGRLVHQWTTNRSPNP